MDGELSPDMVLEPHDDIVPKIIEFRFIGAHSLNHTGVHMCVKMPALDVCKVSSLQRYCEDNWDNSPERVIIWVRKFLVFGERRQYSLVVNDVQVKFGAI